MTDFFEDLPPVSTIKTPKEEIESAVSSLWTNRNVMIIGKKTAIDFGAYEIDLIEDERGIFFRIQGNASSHDIDAILAKSSQLMGQRYRVVVNRDAP